MRTPIIFAASILLPLVAMHPAAAQDKIDAEILFTVSQPAARGLSKKYSFSKQAKPGPGQDLKLWVTANRDCRAVAVAFTRDGKLAYAGPPEKIAVLNNKTTELPPQGKWTWEGKENLAEIDLILASDSSPDYKELATLLDAMHTPGLADAVRIKQVGSLRRWIDSHSQNKSSVADYTVKPLPAEVGAMLRGGELGGQKVSLPANGYTVIRLKLE